MSLPPSSPRPFLKRFIMLNVGLFLYALGIVLSLKAHIGYSPWDIFHVGLSKTFGMSIGTASIGVGLVIMVFTLWLGEKVGLGTLLNMVLIGLFVDALLKIPGLPQAPNLLTGLPLLLVGLFVISLASYFYIGSGFGAGPRDSLMVGLTRKTGWPMGLCRSLIEGSVALLGWRLGGLVGIGTIISTFGIGIFVQWTFKWLQFDATAITHETLDVTCRRFMKSPKI